MPLLTRNAELLPALKITGWRKIAMGTWRNAKDPSVYGLLDLNAENALRYLEAVREKTGTRVTLTHFVGRAMAEVLKRHPDINCILRLGRIYPRKNIDVFYQVATDMEGKDLTGMVIRQSDTKSITEIAQEMERNVQKIRKQGDPGFKKMKSTFKNLPGLLTGLVLDFAGWFMYTLNLWSPLLGSPRDPLGSLMVTNIGSLGLETAFVPLVPYSRVPLLIAVGAVKEEPVVRDGQIVVGKVLRLCATFDHRIIDGVHASHMSKTLKAVFDHPEKELGVGHL